MGGLRHSRQTAEVFGLAALAIALAPAVGSAAWLGYKNNSNAVVIIQTTDLVVVNGQVTPGRAGKPHALYPGEVAWDPISAPGPRMVSVYDGKQKNHLLHQDRVDCNRNDIFLSLQLVQPPAVRGQPQPPPQLKLLPTVLPAQAPGILPPGSMPAGPGARPANPPPTTPGAKPASPPARPPSR